MKFTVILKAATQDEPVVCWVEGSSILRSVGAMADNAADVAIETAAREGEWEPHQLKAIAAIEGHVGVWSLNPSFINAPPHATN